MKKARFVIALLAVSLTSPAVPQAPNASLIAKQAKAMAALSFLDGEWAGPAVAYEASGPIRMTQTERSGTLLGGTVRLIEGRSYDASGRTLFNAFATISYDHRRSAYSITSHASGYVTTTDLQLTSDGFKWEVPAGPGAKMHFTAVVKNGVWSEVGDYVASGKAPRRTFEMTVRKLRRSSWPAVGSDTNNPATGS